MSVGKVRLSSGRQGAIADKKFCKWLETHKYKTLGKEFKTSSHTGGWPDFLVKKNSKLYFFEVKSGNHKVDDHQKEILGILKKLGKVHIMRLDKSMKRFSDETPLELK